MPQVRIGYISAIIRGLLSDLETWGQFHDISGRAPVYAGQLAAFIKIKKTVAIMETTGNYTYMMAAN